MKTVAAAFGYIRPHEDPTSWGADHVVGQPRDVPAVLRRLRQDAAA
jgi:phosphoglycolate phosphatase-like HAD superfamily hydrolase